MMAKSTSLVSDFCITDVLAEVGLNILEQGNYTALDAEHDKTTGNNNDVNLFCLSDKANGCDTKEDTQLSSAPETSKIVDVSEKEGSTGEQELTNYSKHILKISENKTEFDQPVQKKLRLSTVTPTEETNICDKSKLNCSRQTTGCLQGTCNTISGGTAVFPGKQNAGLPSILHSINPNEVFIEKYFGLRIKNPLVTLSMLTEKMSGKQAIHMNRIKNFVQKGEFENNDWVIAGVIVKKHATTSQAGKQYCSWTLSDLRENLLTVTVLLFSNAFKELWKSSVGTVVGILNPLVMESRSQHDGVATFSVRSSDQIMLWGQSSDFGMCEARKKDGEKCTMFVNKRLCSYCVYHAQKEYKKYCGGRSELQKATGGNLRQMLAKKMGWNIPANNKYTGLEERVPVRRNENLIQKDRNLLALLGNDTTLSKCNNKGKNSVTQTDHSFEIKAKTKLQEMLLLSKSTSPGIPNRTSETVSLCHKSLKLGKNSKVTNEKVTHIVKPTFIVKKPDNETCNSTDNNRKQRFEMSLSTLVDSADKKNQNVETGKKNFDSKALLDKIMSTKMTKNAFMVNEKDFSLCIDNKNSGMGKCDSKNNKKKLMEYVTNLNESQQIKITESILEKSNADVESNTPKSYNPNCYTHAESGVVVSLENQSKASQTKIRKCITRSTDRNTENKVKSLNNLKSSPSAKCDNHKVYKEPLKYEYIGKTKQPTDIVSGKKKAFTKDMCSQLTAEMQSEMFTEKHQYLMSPKVPELQSSYGKCSRSMMEAIRYVREHGPIKKNRKSSEMKPLISESQEDCTSEGVEEFKSTSVISDKFKELMNTESIHNQLAESSAMEEYYSKMEQKEKIEDKLLNTYKVECKVVMCKVCKYKASSASEFCKQNNHPLVCVKGYRRFFKCSNCSKRTVVYDIFPHYNCVHCGSSSWIRVPVIEVKTTVADLNQLSLRGDEQKFINSHEGNANINLLIPEN